MCARATWPTALRRRQHDAAPSLQGRRNARLRRSVARTKESEPRHILQRALLRTPSERVSSFPMSGSRASLPPEAANPLGTPEGDWVARIRSGDGPAFEALFHAYHAPLCAFAHRLVGVRDLAEEIVQEGGTRQSVSGGTRRSPRRIPGARRGTLRWERLGLGRWRKRCLWVGRGEGRDPEADSVGLSCRDGNRSTKGDHCGRRDRAERRVGARGSVGHCTDGRPRPRRSHLLLAACRRSSLDLVTQQR